MEIQTQGHERELSVSSSGADENLKPKLQEEDKEDINEVLNREETIFVNKSPKEIFFYYVRLFSHQIEYSVHQIKFRRLRQNLSLRCEAAF